MKKIILFASALAGLFLAGSCQRESLEPEAVGVTYTINLPEVAQTKGNSGYAEYDLYYEVYKTVDAAELETADILFEKKVEMTGNTVTLTLDLLNDQNYTILFWANKKGESYFNVADLRNVEMVQAASNNNDRDAFCGKDQLVNYDAATGRTVTLTRPFAQLNIATLVSTTAGYDMTPKKSYVKVTKVPTVFNVLTSEASGDAPVEFNWAAVPAGKKVNDKYDLVAMNYVLVPESNVYVYYEIETANGTVKNSVDNVPLKPNYRTNIVGNLLTSNATYTIELKPGFEGESVGGTPFYDVPEYDEGTKTWTITKASELAWVAASVNGTIGVNTKSAATSHNFKGETIKLSADIDLENKPWTPIGTVLGESRYTYGFAGTFDGNGKIIKNLKVDHADCAGLFGNMCGGTIKNLTIDGFDLNSDHYAGAILGWGETGANSIVIENCKALNGKIKVNVIEIADGKHDFGDKAGAIVGYSHYGIYTGNEAQNVEIVGYRDLGGIVGYGKNTIVKNCKVTEVTLRQDLTIDYKKNEENESTPTTLDNYIGRKGGTCTIEGNEGTVTKNTNILVEETGEKTATQVFAETLANIVEGDVINVAADVEITLPYGLNAANAETITIAGSGESSVLSGTLNQHGNNQQPGNYAEGKHLVFKDITYKTANNGYAGGFGHAASVTFINCKIIGQMYAHSNAPHYFYDCTIDPLNGYLYTYASDCVFEGCTFEASEGKALQVYGEADVECDVTIKDCTFKAAKQATTWDSKPVTGIDINSAYGYRVNVTIENCKTTGFPTGLNSGSDLYNIKDGGIGKVNLVIDGVYVVRAGYTPVAGYANLYTDKDGVYCIFDKAGLADFRSFLAANTGRHPYDRTYKVMNDIDAEGYVWNSVLVIPDAGNAKGLVLDGNGKTISNLTVAGEGMFNVASAGSVIKNITMSNVTNNSEGHNAAIFWGSVYSSVSFDNVHIKNSAVNGLCNAGAFVGGTYEPNNLVVTFKNCSVENSAVKAVGYGSQDPTGASGFLGKAYASSKVVFEGTNSIDNATTITNENGLAGGKVYGYTIWYNGGWANTGASDTFTNWGGLVFVNTPEALTHALASGANVTLTEDVKTEAATTAPYGNKYAFKLDGGVLDGQGNELYMECYGDDYGIMTSGGTVKNLTITEACRAIMIMYPTQDIVLDNVNIGGDGVLYPINSGEAGSEGVNLIVTNSVLAGWTSFSNIESASFTNVEFKQGTYYKNIYGRVLKPYVNTTLTDCAFVEHMNLDLSGLANGHKITISNCTVNGQTLTADVFTVPSTDAEYDTALFTIDLPSWASSVTDCVVFE